MKKCSICGNDYTPQQVKDKIRPETIKYTHEGKILTDKAIRYNDAFYEIVTGEYKGNLVHIWNVIN